MPTSSGNKDVSPGKNIGMPSGHVEIGSGDPRLRMELNFVRDEMLGGNSLLRGW